MPAADDLRLPTSLAWLREVDDGRAWLRSLPTLMAEACSRCSLTLGDEPYEGSYASVVLPAERNGESSLVGKLQFPTGKVTTSRLLFGPGTGMVRYDSLTTRRILARCSSNAASPGRTSPTPAAKPPCPCWPT